MDELEEARLGLCRWGGALQLWTFFFFFFFRREVEKNRGTHVATYVGQVQSPNLAKEATQTTFSAEEKTRSHQCRTHAKVIKIKAFRWRRVFIWWPNSVACCWNKNPWTSLKIAVLLILPRANTQGFWTSLLFAKVSLPKILLPVISFCFLVLQSSGWIAPCWQGSRLLHAYYEEALHHGGKQSGLGGDPSTLALLRRRTGPVELGSCRYPFPSDNLQAAYKFTGNAHRWETPMRNFKWSWQVQPC